MYNQSRKRVDNMNQLPCSEYPRPQMKRESYLCLNGEWNFSIYGEKRNENGKVIVPFSIESKLGGNREVLKPNETLMMEKDFEIPDGFNIGRVLLHFDAVDGQSKIWINDHLADESECGYLPIVLDITNVLKKVNHICMVIHDPSDSGAQLRGKQSLHPKGIWYSAQSGIWQSVWLESVPVDYIESLKITPYFDEKYVEIFVKTNTSGKVCISCGKQSIKGESNAALLLHLDEMHPWTPENPYLYDLDVTFKEDHVTSYFGMRKFSVMKDHEGVMRLFLNNRPYFQSGLLDQGYNSEGLMSWKDDQMMIDDIQLAKSMGFNMLRKHIKIEPLRWYYHCDRLGMLVWQDMINGGSHYNLLTISSPLITNIHFKDSHYRLFGRKDEHERKRFLEQLKGMIDHLYNCVSISMWVIFNEGWGQFDSSKALMLVQKWDPTRVIDPTSGWHDQKMGDFKSWHVYFKPYKFKKDTLGRCVILSEFGGYQWAINDVKKSFGYKRMESQKELEENLVQLYEKQIIPAKRLGLSACVYTQLSDVESEVNGLVSYDRKTVKIQTEVMKKINERLKDDEK